MNSGIPDLTELLSQTTHNKPLHRRMACYIQQHNTLFSELFSEEITPINIYPLDDVGHLPAITYTISIHVDNNQILLGFSVDEKLCKKIAEFTLNIPFESINDIARDCVAEYLNLIMGYVVVDFNFQGKKIDPNPPRRQNIADFKNHNETIYAVETESRLGTMWLLYVEYPEISF